MSGASRTDRYVPHHPDRLWRRVDEPKSPRFEVADASRTLVYRMLAAGTLPSVRVGRLRRVRPADLERYIESRLEGCDG